MDFVHLHTHSEYSLLDAACKIDDLLNKTKQLGMQALALTDHGAIRGAVEFYQKSKKAGIKPIIGAELYVAPGSRFEKKGAKSNAKYYHLVVLAENNQGYRNLIELTSRGFTEGFYYKPRVDDELLREYHQGLIALTGCMRGEVPSLIEQERMEEAGAAVHKLQDIFGQNNLFLELQNHGLDAQQTINKKLEKISQRESIPTVVTNDVHYLDREDKLAHEVLLNIQTNKTLDDPTRRIYEGEEYFLKSPQEMEEAFPNQKEALQRTLEIADRCEVNLEFDRTLLPAFSLPSDYHDPGAYLRDLTFKKAKERYQADLPTEVKERLKHELSVIKEIGYETYFLIVRDFIQFAKKNHIPVGPGRGSVVGSLVSYCLGITDVDPLKYGLIFERFLSKSRVSPPDIDIDFCVKRRDQVIDYVKDKYGQEKVSQIATFDRLAAKSAVRDVARVMGKPYSTGDKIAKLIPFGSSIQAALSKVRQLKKMYEESEDIKKLIDISKRLEGLARNVSTHAAGVVIAPDKLTQYVPLQRLSSGEILTQFAMDELESVGLLKMDFLGLRNLTVIDETVKKIEEVTADQIDLDELSLTDPKTYQLLKDGKTKGVFQLESSGMKNLVKRMQPTDFEDIIALLALYRPGPLESGMADDYIARKKGNKEIQYPHPELQEVLEDTYGLPIYQEQLMQMARVLAGFSLEEADVLRKAIGKKNRRLLLKMKKEFTKGCVDNGIDEAKAEGLFANMEKFARYGFNKSHSTAYALISYWTAYLKANWPAFYMASLLTSVSGNNDKVAEYIQECKDLGLDVLPPDINQSDVDFTPHGDQIRFGLFAIKHVGRSAVQSILKKRSQGGKFENFYDFCRRVDVEKVNREVIISLIKTGAFDQFATRKALLAELDKGLALGQLAKEERRSGQRSFFSNKEEMMGQTTQEEDLQEEFSESKLLKFEKELLGLYVSGHPLLEYKDILSLYGSCSLKEVSQNREGQKLYLGGRVDQVKVINTRNDKLMAFLTLEDLTHQLEVIVFPNSFEKSRAWLEEDKLIFLEGRTEKRNGKLQVITEEIFGLDEVEKRMRLEVNLTLNCEELTKRFLEELKGVLNSGSGQHPIYIHLREGGRKEVIELGESFKIRSQDIDKLYGLIGDGKISIKRKQI